MTKCSNCTNHVALRDPLHIHAELLALAIESAAYHNKMGEISERRGKVQNEANVLEMVQRDVITRQYALNEELAHSLEHSLSNKK